MRISALLDKVDHRPWPLPAGPWVMAQTWNNLLFAHWPVAVEVLRPLLPPALEIDTYEGQAWLSITPFRMTGVRPRLVPPMPWLSAFPELNVRTYVRDAPAIPPGQQTKPGIFFFSLDAGNRIAVALARLGFLLPYFHAQMSLHKVGDTWHYVSHRIQPAAPAADFIARYRPTGSVFHAPPGSLDHWLTERYCLYTTGPSGRLFRCEIHHWPWPLQPAEAEVAVNTMTVSQGIRLPDLPPRLQFARRLKVAVWPLRKVTAQSRGWGRG